MGCPSSRAGPPLVPLAHPHRQTSTPDSGRPDDKTLEQDTRYPCEPPRPSSMQRGWKPSLLHNTQQLSSPPCSPARPKTMRQNRYHSFSRRTALAMPQATPPRRQVHPRTALPPLQAGGIGRSSGSRNVGSMRQQITGLSALYAGMGSSRACMAIGPALDAHSISVIVSSGHLSLGRAPKPRANQLREQSRQPLSRTSKHLGYPLVRCPRRQRDARPPDRCKAATSCLQRVHIRHGQGEYAQ